jgi:DNA primase
MTLSPSLLEAVRQRARIEDLFPTGALKRSGTGFLTLCPWHNDRSPSLTVSTRVNRVKCFVCDRGEDPIGWLQDQQGLSFQAAVEALAQRYGIPLPEQDPQAAARAEAERRQRQRLLGQRHDQQRRFHTAFLADLARDGPAAVFLRQRGLHADTASAWGLGLNGRRLMLPIRDRQGRCCGFSGRSIGEEEPKYKNTAADALFRKSELLFGLDRAAQAIGGDPEVAAETRVGRGRRKGVAPQAESGQKGLQPGLEGGSAPGVRPFDPGAVGGRHGHRRWRAGPRVTESWNFTKRPICPDPAPSPCPQRLRSPPPARMLQAPGCGCSGACARRPACSPRWPAGRPSAVTRTSRPAWRPIRSPALPARKHGPRAPWNCVAVA